MSANFGCKNYQHPSPSELLLASTSPHKAFLSNTKHRDTGETLKIDTYPWKSAYKQQLVVVASGRSLQEPVIIVPAQRGDTELKIWKGKKVTLMTMTTSSYLALSIRNSTEACLVGSLV
jgi:hypothetical protein